MANVKPRTQSRKGAAKKNCNSSEIKKCHAMAMLLFLTLVETSDFDPKDPLTFETLIKEATTRYDVSVADICEQFSVNASTVARWANGDNAPYKIIRPIIAEWIVEKVDASLKKYYSDTGESAYTLMSSAKLNLASKESSKKSIQKKKQKEAAAV
tara:strand:- start:510 stop:974 length:465 start_codon:yes stop_codon:yes gene_type:complete